MDGNVQSSHFSGGTVTWKPLNITGATNSTISLLFTQSYQWRRLSVYCNDSYVRNQYPLVPPSSNSLSCVTTPSSLCGGYTAISTSGYCTDYSIIQDTTSSQISAIKNITVGSKFCVAFQSGSWVTLRVDCPITNANTTSTTAAPACYSSALSWSIGTCVDLSIRPDSILNTPPVVTMLSPIRLSINTVTDIKIPVIDANGDFLRCRWATKTSTLDECAGVCGQTSGTTLNESTCTLTFNSTGKRVGDYYAVSLMAEDFYSQSSTTPFSSVPIQFLVKIVDTPSCLPRPAIISTLSSCTVAQIDIPFNFTLTITQGCSGTTIVDYFRMPPINMFKSEITQVGLSNVWTVTETWTPTNGQIGSQVYCAIATDSANVPSEQYCTTFTVVPFGGATSCPTDSADRESTTSSTTTTTTSVTTTSTTTITSMTSTTASTSTTSTTTSTSMTSTTTSTSTSSVSNVSTNKPSAINVPLAVGLGLGIPLLGLLMGLILCKCCCCGEKCLYLCGKSIRRYLKRICKRNRSIHDQNNLPDYRQQYINNRQPLNEDFYLNSSSESRQFRQDSLATPSSPSDFELSYINLTRTSLLSPSSYSLPTEHIQFTKDLTSPSTNSMHDNSLLMNAYFQQEYHRNLYTS